MSRWRRFRGFAEVVMFFCLVLLLASPSDAQRSCSVSVSGLAFGNYLPGTATPVDSTANIQVTCAGVPAPGQPGFYTIRIGGGASNNPANRFMPSGPSRLSYNLFQDPALTTVWGDGTSGTSPVVQVLPGGMGMGMGMGMGGGMGMGMGIGAPISIDHTVYGRSFAGQDPIPGAYADMPIVTVEF